MKRSILLCLLLAACGGGGGGNPVPVPYSFPVRAAAMAFLTNQQSFIMVSPIMPPPPNALIMSGGSLTTPPPSISTFSYTSAPGGNSSFEGQAVSTTNVTLDGPTTEIVYFTISPFEWVGQTSVFPPNPFVPSSPSTSQYSVYANQVPLPVMATIGSSGPLDTGTDYTDSTKKTVVDTFAQTWTLIEGETPDLPYFCTTTVVVTSVKPINLRGPNTSFCLRIDFNGDVLGESLSYIGTSEGTLTFTN